MNAFRDIMESVLWQRLGWAVLHSLWQGPLIGAAFWVCRAAWRESAKARYAAGCIAMGLMVLVPSLTSWSGASPSTRAIDSSSPGIAFNLNLGLGQASTLRGGPQIPAGLREFYNASGEWLNRSAPLLAGAWAIGVILFSARLAREYSWMKRIGRAGLEPVDSCCLEMLDDLCCRLQVSRPVQLMKSALVEVPTMIGWLRPLILLPAATAAGLTPGQLQTILAHELAHIRRFDYLVNTFQCLLETLLFYHPVMWWISNCVREERENCCDDLVVEICDSRLVYARALAALEELRSKPVQWRLAASGGSLMDRIQRLIGGTTNPGPRGPRLAGGLGMIGLGLLLICLGILLGFGPPIYQATARIRVEREFSLQLKAQGTQTTVGLYDPDFFENQCAIIGSELVLRKVIDGLNLNVSWGKRYGGGSALSILETITRLRKRLSLLPVRNTALLEIRVSGDVPEETDRTANAIADAYANYRREQRSQEENRSIEYLRIRYDEQDQKIHKATRELEDFAKALKVPVSLIGPNGWENGLSPEALGQIKTLQIQKRQELGRDEALLEELKKIPESELAQALPTAVPDPLLNSLLEQSALADQNLLAAGKDYGPEHLEAVKARARVEDLRARIKQRTSGILLGLTKRVEAMRAGMARLEAELEEAAVNDAARAEQIRPYLEKRRELEDLTQFRKVLTMKIAAESVTPPTKPEVQIVDRAVTPYRPSAPNRPRAAALILAGLLLDLGGFLMLRGPRSLNPEPRI